MLQLAFLNVPRMLQRHQQKPSVYKERTIWWTYYQKTQTLALNCRNCRNEDIQCWCATLLRTNNGQFIITSWCHRTKSTLVQVEATNPLPGPILTNHQWGLVAFTRGITVLVTDHGTYYMMYPLSPYQWLLIDPPGYKDTTSHRKSVNNSSGYALLFDIINPLWCLTDDNVTGNAEHQSLEWVGQLQTTQLKLQSHVLEEMSW